MQSKSISYCLQVANSHLKRKRWRTIFACGSVNELCRTIVTSNRRTHSSEDIYRIMKYTQTFDVVDDANVAMQFIKHGITLPYHRNTVD